MKKITLLLKILSCIVVLYGLVGFFIVPGLVKEQITKNLETQLTRKVSVDSVSFNPFTFQLGVHKLNIYTQDGKPSFAGVRNIKINLDPLNLVFGEVKIKFIEILAPFVSIHKNKEGQFNFSDLLVTKEPEEIKKKEEDLSLPSFVIEKFSIQAGEIHFLDDTGSKPFEKTLTPIRFALRDFSTKEDHNNQLSLHIKLDDGATVDYRGKINSIVPLRLEGELKLHSGRLYTQWEYFRDELGFIVADGALDASMHYTANLSADPAQININEYKLQIQSLRLQDKASREDILELPLFSLDGNANITSKQVNISNFDIKGFTIKVRRDEAGVINWVSYLPAGEEQEETNETSPWKVNIAKVNIKTDELFFEEHFSVEPYIAKLQNLSVEVKDINLLGSDLFIEELGTDLSEFSLKTLSQKHEYLRFEAFSINAKMRKTESTDVNISRINLAGLNLFAKMDKKGVLDLSRLSAKEEKGSETNETSSVLNWQVEDLRLSDAMIDIKDDYNAENGHIVVDKVNVNVSKLSSTQGSWADTELLARINKSGQLKIDTKLRQSPLKINSTFELKGLDLVSFQGYMNKNANIDINKGTLNLDFKAEHNDRTTKILANTLLTDLSLSERREGKKFFAFSKLSVKDIDLSLNPDQMKISKVDIYMPYMRMKIDQNKSSNIDDLVRPSEKKLDEKAKKPFAAFIGKVNFKEGKGEFTDLSLPLPFKTEIHSLNGKMLALGNLPDIKTTVDIDGTVDEYGLAKIQGKLLSASPKDFTDMEVKFQNIDMTNLSPYTGKFIGYKLKNGKMNVELSYKINDSQMQGGNRIILKKMTLGEEVESEDAISAPVGLAIALLQDNDGVIDLDVPVSGDVNAPDFEIGHVVWTAFKNLITGVATAPFRFLGNMLGVNADELENIQFEAAKSNLLPPEQERLDKLSKALLMKEMLILKVSGTYDEKRDTLAMKTAKVYEEALSKLDDKTTDISQMDRNDLDDLLKEMYVSHFTKEQLELNEDSIDAKDMSKDMKKVQLRKEMIEALTNDQKVSKNDLIVLGQDRTRSIITYLEGKGISKERLEPLKPLEAETSTNEYIPLKLELGAR